MSIIASTPAASRIAQIRSNLGRQSNTGGGATFALQLDSVRTPTVSSPSAFTVGQPSAGQPGVKPPAGQPIPSVPALAATPLPASPTATFVDSGPTTVSEAVPYASLFNAAGNTHEVDPALLASVAQIESAFDPTAISHAGAQGLMQFMPATAGEMGVDPFDPESAVDGAARYLRRELDRFGSVELALAAYNAGPGAVQRHGGVPPFAETQRYVDKVLNALESHR